MLECLRRKPRKYWTDVQRFIVYSRVGDAAEIYEI